MKRVVVTGMGALCSHGDDVASIWAALYWGETRIAPINADTHFDSEKYQQTRGKVVAAIPHTDDQLRDIIDPNDRQLKRWDRHQLFALIASSEALKQAGNLGNIDRTRFGISVGTGDGGLTTGFASDERLLAGQKLPPSANLGELPNIFAGYLANRFGLKGPSFVHCTACAASAHAIMHGADQIALNRADVMLVGGAEAAITPFGIGSFAAQGAMGSGSRPYQTKRDGFVMGEGSAMLVIESEEHALNRGARILARVAGYGATTDGNTEGTITAPDADGGYRSAKIALQMADLDPTDIDYVNTHGTGTMADAIELSGIDRWSKRPLTVSSTKSSHGHLLGAAGALEAVLSIMMIKESRVLPTAGLTVRNLDPDCAIVHHVIDSPLSAKLRHVLSNSFGFGGTNATLIFSKS